MTFGAVSEFLMFHIFHHAYLLCGWIFVRAVARYCSSILKGQVRLNRLDNAILHVMGILAVLVYSRLVSDRSMA